MFHNFLDSPNLFRHLVEDLPVGIYIVDQERQIRFWNRGAEKLTGHLSHEVVGHILEDALEICDRRGNPFKPGSGPVARTLSQRQPQQCNAFYLHKNGHRTAVSVRTRPIMEPGDAILGATVLLEETFIQRDEPSGPPMYGCLDATTGLPSRRLTQALLNECLAGMEASHNGFGLLRIRLPELAELRVKHGPQSVAPFLHTAALTLRNSLDAENFLGCWEENEFLAVLISTSPMRVAMTADILSKLLGNSSVSWWGDRFLIAADVSYTIATVGKDLNALLGGMTASHAGKTAKAAAASAPNNPAPPRG